MNTSDMLHEAEADLAALAGLPGEIRARVKAGLAELQRLRDAIDAAIAGLTARASATLASLQAMAAAEGRAAAETLPDPAPAAVLPAVPEAGAATAGSFGG